MFVDASALTAILAGESDARALLARLQQSRRRVTSALAMWETGVAISRLLDIPVEAAGEAVEQFTALAEIDVIAVAPEAYRLALAAFDLYGKSRHPAALNFGDCFAYACARHARMPLLCKGNDFPQTDIELA